MKKHIFAAVITLIVAGVGYYFTLPALSVHNAGLLVNIIFLAVVYLVVLKLGSLRDLLKGGPVQVNKTKLQNMSLATKIILGIVAVCAVLFVVGSAAGWVIFRAASYRTLLPVSDGSFTTDVEEISYDQIPTLDLASAMKLGDRKMGELSDLVSQFEVLDNYTQINYKGRPTRVTPLGYADVFKWFNNVGEGIPAYISIDMVTQEVTVHRLETGMKYTNSDHFNRYLMRHLRFHYPTLIFDTPNFEIDEDGVPYWVCPVIRYRIGLYGGRDIGGIVLVNAVSGEHQYYASEDVPDWIDRVYNPEMIIEQYDYYGTLQRGYWNSVFGQRECRQTTDGYNYIAIGDDVYMYTGVTSVTADESNVGFILTNQRTKETRFYTIAGAEEYSAMASAEGEVQNLRYSATFPLLLNISNEPTYFVALKDEAGLVKMYAMVNVRQYQIVGKGQTLRECEEDYTRQLRSADIVTDEGTTAETVKFSGVVTDIRTAVVDGNSVYYFKLEGSDKTFRQSVSKQEEIVTYNIGDTLRVEYSDSESAVISVINIGAA